jgi:hypothetical protein
MVVWAEAFFSSAVAVHRLWMTLCDASLLGRTHASIGVMSGDREVALGCILVVSSISPVSIPFQKFTVAKEGGREIFFFFLFPKQLRMRQVTEKSLALSHSQRLMPVVGDACFFLLLLTCFTNCMYLANAGPFFECSSFSLFDGSF